MNHNVRGNLSVLAAAVLLLTVASCQRSCNMHLSWEYGKAREVNYSVIHERGYVNGAPEAVENYTLKLKFGGNKNVEVLQDGVSKGSFSVTPAGDLDYADTSSIPPYLSNILLLTIPPDGIYASAGSTWESLFPGTSQVNAITDKITMQDRYAVRVESTAGDTAASLRVEGHVKLVRNRFTEMLLDDTSGTFNNLYNWNMFLASTATYSANSKAIEQMDAYYMLMPDVNQTADSLRQSRHRQHTILTRIP